MFKTQTTVNGSVNGALQQTLFATTEDGALRTFGLVFSLLFYSSGSKLGSTHFRAWSSEPSFLSLDGWI